MKKVQIILTDFEKISKLQPDWKNNLGRAEYSTRKIYLSDKLPKRTTWGHRLILEHEKAHFYIHDAGIKLDKNKDEMLADWLGLVRTPNKYLELNEKLLKDWIKSGLKGPQVILRIVQLLEIGDREKYNFTAAALWRAM